MSNIKVGKGWFGAATLAEGLEKARADDVLLVDAKHTAETAELKIQFNLGIQPPDDSPAVVITQPIHVVAGVLRLSKLRLEAPLKVSGTGRIELSDCELRCRHGEGPADRSRLGERKESQGDRQSGGSKEPGRAEPEQLHLRGQHRARPDSQPVSQSQCNRSDDTRCC